MKKVFLFFACILTFSFVNAQTELKKPEASQAAMAMQRIGLTDIVVSYHSPFSKGRNIWGDLVPYNEVWRAGANENTTISFSTPVMIEGKPLAAGTYGLHMIPSQTQWTILFNKNSAAWGSFFYDEKEEILRVQVTPKSIPEQNWLSYVFIDPLPNSVTIQLCWDKLGIPVKIEVDVHETVFQSMKKELTHINGFFWQGYNEAAAYCIANNVHMEEASKWIDKSISLQKNFPNLTTKATLFEKTGRKNEAEVLRKEALALADEAQLNAFGYQLLGQGKTNEAIDIFRLNVKQYPKSWNVYDSLGEALLASGDKNGALTNYKTALSKAPEDQKKRINAIINKF